MSNGAVLFASTLLLAGLLSACGPTEWEKAQQAGTIAAYEAFVAGNPNSEFLPAAKERIAAMSWDEAKTLNSVDSYGAYLSKFPEGEHAADAIAQLTALRWERAAAADSVDAYVEFAREAASAELVDRAREAVRTLQRKNEPGKPGQVELQGIFGNNTIKYVDSLGVTYEGHIAGYPAKVSYAVTVGVDHNGKQMHFVFRDENAVLAMNAPATVTGRIELATGPDQTTAFELSDIVQGPKPDLAGSFLVARNPPMLWSNVGGKELVKTSIDAPASTLKAGEAVLFEVQPDFGLLYVP